MPPVPVPVNGLVLTTLLFTQPVSRASPVHVIGPNEAGLPCKLNWLIQQ